MRKVHLILIIVTLVVLFGALMAFQHEVSGLWFRAGIAALAGGILGCILILTQRRHS